MKIKYNPIILVFVGQASLDLVQAYVESAQVTHSLTHSKLHAFAMIYHQFTIVNYRDVSLVP